MGQNMTKSTIKPKILYLEDKKKNIGILSILNGSKNDTYEFFYKELVKIPESQPVDIIITTHGGEALWCSKICYVLKNRTGESRVFVKSYAHSAGTIIALAATKLFITYDTSLSAIDTQCSPFSDLFQTSLQGLSKFIENPIATFSEMSKERAQYFREMTEKYLNKIHNKNLLMQKMHDEPPIHEQLFFKEDMNDLGIIYNLWDGNVKNIPNNISDSKLIEV